MSTGQQVAFQPALAQVFAQHFHDATVGRNVHVHRFKVRHPGPGVRYLQGLFAENWRQASGVVLAGDTMFPPLTPAGNARVVPLSAAPGGSISDIAFVYWLLFHTAREEVRIATPYFVPDPDLELGIAEARGAG